MEIIIKSVNFRASNRLEELIIEKVNKLSLYSTTIIKAVVVLREEEKNSQDNKLCEIKLMVPGYDHYTKKKTDLYEKSISQAIETLQNTLLKTKNKLIAKRHSHDLV
jgi:putative sigma-54 modulation protein